jgi:hypothetical protein
VNTTQGRCVGRSDNPQAAAAKPGSMIRWPDHATVVQPARYDAVAAEIMRLLASAVTAYNQHKARRL